MQSKIEAIKAKVAQCIAQAESKLGIKMPPVHIRFDLTGRAAGMACCTMDRWTRDANNFSLRFNTKHMQLGGQTWEHLLNDTVPHEVAHTVCQAYPQFGRNHDAGWKRVCIALGGNGRTRYGEDDAPEAIAAMRPYVYITTNGHEVRVTKVIHSKVQTRGASYAFKGGKGSINKSCQFNYMTAPAQAQAKKPVVINTPAPAVVPKAVVRPTATASVAATGSKADQLRAYLAQAKRDVGSEAEEKTVLWAIATLGMTRTLARTYVKNNWNKV